jgi:kynureninase
MAKAMLTTSGALVDSTASDMMFPIVGAEPTEVAVMNTLTANLHFLMSAFYKPDINKRHKIIIESKAFPSDHVSLLPAQVLLNLIANSTQ